VHESPSIADPRTASVVVPIRSFENAKSRLGAVLDAEERRDLVDRLLRRTVRAALATPGVVEVVVVSPDPEVLDAACDAGARPLLQGSRGLNPALAEAREAITGERLLVIPGDLPALGVADLAALLAAGGETGSPSVVLAPDRHGRGTNALLLDPPDAIDPAFGGDSRVGHAWLASAADIAYAEVTGRPGLDLDLDTADDLLLAEALEPGAVRVD
jgi:2-phospho-L-lactate/phosphoenolpyruvate guanylyltransferase